MALELQINGNKIFAPLKGKELIKTPEEEVRQRYILKLVNTYGYELEQMAQERSVSNALRGQGRASADIVIWKSEEAKNNNEFAEIVIECKADTIKIQPGDYYQGANYASWAHSKFFVTTNQKEIKYFKTSEKMPVSFLEEIIDIPKAAELSDEVKIKALLAQKKKFSRVDFQRLLFECHSIFRDNDALAPDAAFDEISKILFMKINYERNRKTGEDEIFKWSVFEQKEKDFEEFVKPTLIGQNPLNASLRYVDFWFDDTKRKYKDEKLFEDNDKIKITIESFKKVVEKLEAYNLSDTDDDIKGIAFEEFLSKTFRGKGLGQYFTPRTVVKFMTEIIDPKEGELICDPCCGSGGFLIYAFEYIRLQIEKDIELQKEKIKNEYFKQLQGLEKLSEKEYQKIEIKVNEQIEKAIVAINKDFGNKVKGTRLHNLSYKCIYGTDKEARSARMAKMNMIMHGDGHGGVHQYEGLLNINGIKENHFDVVLTNPPFGSRVGKDLKDPNNPKENVADKFAVSKISTLKEVMFLDRCLNLLKAGGRLGIVLPEGVLNNSQLQNVREYFEGRAKILLIVSIPADVFVSAGATVKPSLLFVKKFTKEEAEQYEKVVDEVNKEMDEKYQPEFEKAAKPLKILEQDLKTKAEGLKKIKADKKAKPTKKLLAEKEAEIADLKKQIVEAKKELKKENDEIEKRKQKEKKATIKERFDYEIPVAQVEHAGITSTGDRSERNELDDVTTEFTKYRIDNKLWGQPNFKVEYKVEKSKTFKISNGIKEELNA